MSITVNSTPQQFQPVYNPYNIVMSSTNSGETNFKIICAVYDTTDTGNSTLVGSFKYPTDTNGYVKADLTRILRDYVTHDFELGLALSSDCPNSIKRFTVYTQESFGTPPSATGTIVTVGDATETYSLFVWNGAIPFDSFATYTKNDYILKYSNYSTNKYLTNADIDTGLDMSTNQNGYVHILLENLDNVNVPISLIDYIKIKTYNSAGTLLGTWKVNTDYTTSFNTTTGYHVRIPVGTYNISQIGSLDLQSGALPILTASVDYYTVQVGHDTYGDGYPIRVNIVEYCNSPQVFRLHWLNRKGGFDSFNFEMYNTQSIGIERKTFKKPYGTVTSGTWSYSASDRLTTTMLTTSKRNYRIVSNWISEDEAVWLEELLTSPVVFWEVDYQTLKAINILDNAYEVKYSHKDKVFNIELTFEETFDYTSQTY